MPDKKPLTFCIDWMRSRAEHTPMPASRATMLSIVAYLEELESLKETLDMYGGWDGINAVYQKLEDLKTTGQQAERPRTNGATIRAMSDEELAGILARGDYLCGMDEACYGFTDDACRKHAIAWLKREAP